MAAPHKDKIYVLLVDHVELFYAEKAYLCAFFISSFLAEKSTFGVFK